MDETSLTGLLRLLIALVWLAGVLYCVLAVIITLVKEAREKSRAHSVPGDRCDAAATYASPYASGAYPGKYPDAWTHSQSTNPPARPFRLQPGQRTVGLVGGEPVLFVARPRQWQWWISSVMGFAALLTSIIMVFSLPLAIAGQLFGSAAEGTWHAGLVGLGAFALGIYLVPMSLRTRRLRLQATEQAIW